MAKGFGTGQIGYITFVVGYVEAFHIKSYRPTGFTGVTGSEFPDRGRSKNFFTTVGTFIDQHLEKYCHIPAIGKQSGVPADSIPHSGPHIVHITLDLFMSEISVLFGRDDFFQRKIFVGLECSMRHTQWFVYLFSYVFTYLLTSQILDHSGDEVKPQIAVLIIGFWTKRAVQNQLEYSIRIICPQKKI